MSLRTIMIFPEFDNIEVINKIRKEYDPLSKLVKTHITIVFPFEDSISNDELKSVLDDRLKNIEPFDLELKGFSKCEDRFGNYLFLNVISDAGSSEDWELGWGEDVLEKSIIDEPEKLKPLYKKYKDRFHCVYQRDIYTGEQWLEEHLGGRRKNFEKRE